MTKTSRAAFAALVIAASATTASADDSFNVDLYHTNLTLPVAYTQQDARAAFASARVLRAMRRAPTAVYENGQYVGQDPDANVRLQLGRDYPIQ